MTLIEFEKLLKTADPKARHYRSANHEKNYTVWQEFRERAQYFDNCQKCVVIDIQVDRFTLNEYDEVAEKIKKTLNLAKIGFEYLVLYEKDTGYIHHVFDCSVVCEVTQEVTRDGEA